MSAKPILYRLNNSVVIREESNYIVDSILKFKFDLDDALLSMNTIKAHLDPIIEDLSIHAEHETQKKYDFMKAWLDAFLRMQNKTQSTHPKNDYLFYGAALTIQKFLDDHHL